MIIEFIFSAMPNIHTIYVVLTSRLASLTSTPIRADTNDTSRPIQFIVGQITWLKLISDAAWNAILRRTSSILKPKSNWRHLIWIVVHYSLWFIADCRRLGWNAVRNCAAQLNSRYKWHFTALWPHRLQMGGRALQMAALLGKLEF